jgi:hypothetical protein
MAKLVYMQQLIGVDKKNPFFTLCRNPKEPDKIYVYFGTALMEVVKEGRNNPEFKILIARLYNAGLKVKTLKETFKIHRTTMKRWGDALKSDDPEELVRVFAVLRHPRKLTKEILAFSKKRFFDIYKENKYSYSAEIRKEIKEVFNKDISGETLRPHFKKWKEKHKEVETTKEKEVLTKEKDASELQNEKDLELPSSFPSLPVGSKRECLPVIVDTEDVIKKQLKNSKPKQTLFFLQGLYEYYFCHHVGVLLFSMMITKLDKFLEYEALIVKQWISAILLGAINIEQTKLLDFNALEVFFGKVFRNLQIQRAQLLKMSLTDQYTNILKYNASLVQANTSSDFYYDPHTKHYSGAKKIFKGWCSSIRFADKIMNMDFIHTSSGFPVYMFNTDNFHDLRERFFKVTILLRELLGFSKDKALTFIFDRGIFKLETFQNIMKSKYVTYFLTWEKGYKKNMWDEYKISGRFDMFKARNSAEDLKRYQFEYIDQLWERDDKIRQIIVRATNPGGRTIEVSILTNDLERSAREIIELMFSRWIQENDFKYLDKHFGINEITSYRADHYKKLEKVIEDKDIKSGEYKALEKRKRKLRTRLGSLLVQGHKSVKTSAKRELKIKEMSAELEQVEIEMENTQKEVSRLHAAIEEDFYKLDTSQKLLMDSIKILARNMFYLMLEPFKKLYNNYRDDHVLFRNITRSHGCIRIEGNVVEVVLFPTVLYQPKVYKIVETIIDEINATQPQMPDNSGLTIRFSIGGKKKILSAVTQ